MHTLSFFDDVEPLFVVQRNADVVLILVCSYYSRLLENIVDPVHLPSHIYQTRMSSL